MRRLGVSFWLLLVVTGLCVAAWHMDSPQAEEVSATPTPSVSDAEFEMYVAVYKAMQEDHGKDIEEALRPHGVDLETFRALERRVQASPKLVEKVREELLEFARSRSALALSPVSPTPAGTPEQRARPKKQR